MADILQVVQRIRTKIVMVYLNPEQVLIDTGQSIRTKIVMVYLL